MRARYAALALVLVAGCTTTTGDLVLVTVTSHQTLTLDHLDVTASIGAVTRNFSVPLKTKSIPPSHTFAIDVADSYAGTIEVSVSGVAAAGATLATVAGAGTLKRDGTVDITLYLDAPVTPDGGTPGDGNTNVDMPTSNGDMEPAVDLLPPVDMVQCGTLVGTCAASTLTQTCSMSGNMTTVFCPNGCLTDHCGQIQPTAPITAADVYATDLASSATTLPTGVVVFDTALGTISAGATVRNGNGAPAAQRQVVNGIGFRLDTLAGNRMVAIWSFNGLVVPASTTVYFTGTSNAAALVSTSNMLIQGTLNLQPYDATNGTCAVGDSSPGGGQPTGDSNFSGTGGTGTEADGSPNDYWAGGGGGGFCDVGGSASQVVIWPGGKGGATYGNTTLSPLIGGSGGGWAQNEDAGDQGGSGGGAVQLVAADLLGISGKINAGGCGANAPASGGGGRGGGAGGGILLEAPTVSPAGAVIAANGGGGSGGGASGCGRGGNATASTVAAAGGTCGTGSAGGAGAVGNAAAGAGGAYVLVSTNEYSGGGGGGPGRIRINATTLMSGGTFSPSLAACNTSGTIPIQ